MEFVKPSGDGIILPVHQVMRCPGDIIRFLPVQFGHQLAVRTVVSRRDHDESLYALALKIRLVQLVQSVDEDIDAFVLVLIAASDTYENGILRHCLSGHGRSHLYKLVPGGGSDHRVVFFRRCETVLETVRRHDIHLAAEELTALIGRDITHRGEHISVLR